MKHPLPTHHDDARAPELELCVESLGGLGDGIASHEGVPVFIPKTLAGEKVRVRITGRTRENARAELLEVLTPSPHRQPAACTHYAQCGGCTLQHMDDATYREFKLRRARDAVRMAGYDPALLAPLVQIPPASRRRTEFKIIYTPTGVSLAYLGTRSHEPVAIEDCKILSPILHSTSASFSAVFATLLSKERLHSLQLTEASNGVDVVIEAAHALADETKKKLIDNIPPHCIRLSLTDGKRLQALWQNATPVLALKKASVAIPPSAFLQASLDAQNAITARVAEALSGAKRVVDLFAGLGIYSLSLPKGTFALAVESDRRMVEAIRRAATQNKLEAEVKALVRDLFVSPLPAKELSDFDAAVINPPRTGAKAQCEQIALSSGLRRVVMVSCNPATFTRDAKILREGGFSLKSVVPIDQFTWTAHLEMVALFEKL